MKTPSTQPKILITGGTGFAGSHLVEELLAAGYVDIHVTTFNLRETYVSKLLPADHIHQVNLTSATETNALIQNLQPTQIYHLAAYAIVGNSFEQGQSVLDHNLHLQLNILEAVRQHSPHSRILIVGSAMEYDLISHRAGTINELHPLGPVSPYAVSKVIQDLLGLSYAYSYKLDIVRARPFNHIGERQTVDFAIPSFAQQIVAIEQGKQQEIRVGNLDAVRDFCDVKDVARAYILLMEKGQSTEVYNIGSGQGHSMNEILQLLCSFSSAKIAIITDPNKVRPLDVPTVIADSSKIKELGWTPRVPIENTLRRILEEWRNK